MTGWRVERTARCPVHGLVVVELERLTSPPETWACHRKPDGRWHRFKIKQWTARRVSAP